MSPDHEHFSASLRGLTPKDAHAMYEMAKEVFIAVTYKALEADPELVEHMSQMLGREPGVLRVMHLISAGYSGTSAFYLATTTADLSAAARLQFVAFDGAAKVHILTGRGQQIIARWYDFMGLLKDHDRFAGLWNEVTNI